MKHVHTSANRAYRNRVALAQGETAFQVVVEETDLYVVARRDLSRQVAACVTELRGAIKTHIALHPAFAHSLSPLPVPDGAPAIVRAMARGAQAADVGPMAAVAGTVAQFVADRLAETSPDILVENGGDLYLHSTRERTVAVLADPASDAHIGIRIPAGEFPCSLCASSATIGHSLSLGHGDLVVARSRDAALADAAATALCNMVNSDHDLETVTARAREMGLDGVLAQHGKHLAAWGAIELVAL